MRFLPSAFRFSLCCAVLSGASVVLAQFPGGGGGWGGGMGGMGGGWGGGGWGGGGMGGGGMGGGGWGGRRGGGGGGWDPNAMWDRMDTNSNGVLEPGEMQGRARGFLERFAGDAGLDLSQPIPLADIKRIMQERFQRGGRGGGGGGGPAGGGGGDVQPAENSAAPASGTSSTTAKTDSLVPGFGVTENLPPVPGFGEAAPAGAKGRGRTQAITVAAVSASSGSSGGGAKSGGFSYADAPLDAKIVRYAEGMLKQYDANKDGVLQKEEWSKMRGDPKGADKNGDEILTKDEVAEQLANYGKKQGGDDKGKGPSEEPKHGSSQGPAVATAPSAPAASSANNASPRFAVRFLTPTERLPKGLPSWFAGKDANGDGQVLMAEYASTWSDSKVAEFDKYDLNGDGIITAKECLRAEKK